jgi:hypothetical protein
MFFEDLLPYIILRTLYYSELGYVTNCFDVALCDCAT